MAVFFSSSHFFRSVFNYACLFALNKLILNKREWESIRSSTFFCSSTLRDAKSSHESSHSARSRFWLWNFCIASPLTMSEKRGFSTHLPFDRNSKTINNKERLLHSHVCLRVCRQLEISFKMCAGRQTHKHSRTSASINPHVMRFYLRILIDKAFCDIRSAEKR